MIELFSFKKLKDFGVDYNFALLKTEIYSVMQISVGYCDEDGSNNLNFKFDKNEGLCLLNKTLS